jgi:hypothetical protein
VLRLKHGLEVLDLRGGKGRRGALAAAHARRVCARRVDLGHTCSRSALSERSRTSSLSRRAAASRPSAMKGESHRSASEACDIGTGGGGGAGLGAAPSKRSAPAPVPLLTGPPAGLPKHAPPVASTTSTPMARTSSRLHNLNSKGTHLQSPGLLSRRPQLVRELLGCSGFPAEEPDISLSGLERCPRVTQRRVLLVKRCNGAVVAAGGGRVGWSGMRREALSLVPLRVRLPSPFSI